MRIFLKSWNRQISGAIMRKTQVYSGIILALVLLYSNPSFARNHESEGIGAQGMLSAGEMRTATKAGGTFTSQGNVLNGGTQVRYHSDGNAPSGPILNPRTDPRSAPITNANTVNQLNTKGYSGGPGGTVILSGTGVSGIVSRAMSSPNGSTDRAVSALQSTANAVSQALNLPVMGQSGVTTQISSGGVNVPAVGIPQSLSQRGAARDALDQKWRDDNKGKTNYYGKENQITAVALTGPATTGSAGYTMNPLDGTEAGAILGIEPGSTSRAVVQPANTVTVATVTPGGTYTYKPANGNILTGGNPLKSGIRVDAPLDLPR
jgi:hypothetical protein